MRRRLRHGTPAFMIPGAQKCGTTALAVFLQRHPSLELSATKEPDFFSREARYGGLGLDHYRAEFRRRRPLRRAVFFEASVSYLPHPLVPERLVRFDPELRFVVMVREPASRAYSAWNMYRTLVSDPGERLRFEAWLTDHDAEDRAVGLAMLADDRFPSFAEAVGTELETIERHGPRWILPGLVSWGLYAEQLERFLLHFPAERFLVVEDRELAGAPARTLERVVDFLGVPPHDWGDSFPRVLVGRYEDGPDDATLDRLRGFYAEPNRRFFELVGREFDW